MLACATCASLSRSYWSGVISSLFENFLIRDFQVSARCSSFSILLFSLGAVTTCSVWALSTATLVSLPTAIMSSKPTKAKPITTPASFISCRAGTRPMIIMRYTTEHSRAAVDRFSTIIRKAMGATMHRMYLKAFLSAPFSRCMALRIWAVASTMVPLAISDGWNVKPKILIHRLASPVRSPAASTHSSSTTVMMSKKGVISLK